MIVSTRVPSAARRTIDFSFTVEDKTTFTKKFVVAVPMTQIEGPMYEYACHEGNYGLANMLSGARAMDRSAAEQK